MSMTLFSSGNSAQNYRLKWLLYMTPFTANALRCPLTANQTVYIKAPDRIVTRLRHENCYRRAGEQAPCTRRLQMLLYDLLYLGRQECPQQTTVLPLVLSTSATSDACSSLSETAATERLKSSVAAWVLSLDLDLVGPATRGLKRAAPVFTGGRSNFLSGSSNLVLVRDGDESAPVPPTAALVEPALVHAPPGVDRDGVFGSLTSGGNSFDNGSLPPPETELEVEDS